MLDSKRGWKRFEANPEAYVVSQTRKKQVEVQERKLSAEEANRFSEAKQIEVKNFIAAECLLEDKLPDKSKVIGMRWLLTWKYDPKYEDGRKGQGQGRGAGIPRSKVSLEGDFSSDTIEGWETVVPAVLRMATVQH